MHNLLKTYTQILLLRQSPEVLPDSWFLLGLAGLANCLAGIIGLKVAGVLQDGMPAAVLQVAANVAILALWFWGLLSLTGFSHRLRQGLSAALGCEALLGLIALPVYLLIRQFPSLDPQQPAPPALLFGLILYFALLFWMASMLGHILARAMEVGRFAGLGLGVAYVVLNLALMEALFPIQS